MMDFLKVFLQLKPEGFLILLGFMVPVFLYLLVQVRGAVGVTGTLRNQLNKLRTQVKEHLEGDEPFQAEEDFEGLADTTGHKGLLFELLTAMLYARKLNNPDLSAIGGTIAEKLPGLQHVRNIPNLLMLAGLLGTVLGLASAISSLGPQIATAASATDPSQLAKALGSTMGLMQGAFGCSLWGILFSLLAAFVLQSAQKQLDAFQDELGAFTVLELAPVMLPHNAMNQLDRMRSILKGVSDSVRTINESFGQVTGDFGKVLGEAAGTLNTTLDKLITSTNNIQQTFEGSQAAIKQSAQSLQSGAETLAKAQQNAAKLMEDAQVRSARQLEQAHEELRQRIMEQVRKIDDLQTSFVGQSVRIIQGIENTQQQVSNSIKLFRDLSDSQVGFFNTHRQDLKEEFHVLQGTLSRHIQDHRQYLETLAKQNGVRPS
ncbi:hypothetical protein [Deinococcus roseus]|uniref:MotA/TolQ/ExbB proton channel domain-containing protein n=1 Tax=Deinococcus roseus TaxID=392414 RepID=A0ABQ2CVX3_9DEIO|nr:hypothetical protein [Deinococcus roseus]GGJ26107.1 hypothetical protein GCM10008938_10290 [Deinococcus roseus]